jgi:3-methyladenine DNA glycosylase AlkD
MLHPAEDRVMAVSRSAVPASGAPAQTPRQAARAAKRALARLGRPAGDFDARRYFRGTDDLRFHNVGTDTVRALARSIHAANQRTWSIRDATELADILIKDRYLEVKSVGIELAARYHRDFAPGHLGVWKGWLVANHCANWATTDSICCSLIGPLLVKYPQLGVRMLVWARDRNLWVRRAAAVGLILAIRQGAGAVDLAYEVARRLHPDQEDLIQKAAGWMLREAGKIDQPRLERYLRANGPDIPRTTLRYAIERFPVRKRRDLLEATRSHRRHVRSVRR